MPPPSTEALQERLVELRDFDAMELYRDAMSHGRWAQTAMRELGFPNTYTFCKAVAAWWQFMRNVDMNYSNMKLYLL